MGLYTLMLDIQLRRFIMMLLPSGQIMNLLDTHVLIATFSFRLST